MGELIAKMVGLGGFLEGSKTILGVVTAIHFLIGSFRPDYQPVYDHILATLGIVLLPVGLADKAVKSQ